MVKTFDLRDGGKPAPRKPRGKRGRPKNDLDGWILLDKPQGLTSTQALAAVKRLFLPAKAGHAGTLDPLATGLLPLALGEATKTVPYVVDGEKSYRFTIRWGAQTDTDDSDGEVIATSDVRPSRDAIDAALVTFVGEIEQIPPQYSAVKINGQRAYDLARGGETVEIKPRTVTITRLEIVGEPSADEVTLEADCGKGTYVRAIARDLGAALGTAGHVTALRRTRVGPFGEADMVTLDALSASAEADTQAALDGVLRKPADALASVPALPVDQNASGRLRRGQAILLRPTDPVPDGLVRAMSGPHVVALCEPAAGELRPLKVFKPARHTIRIEPSAQAAPAAPAPTAPASGAAG